MDMPPLPLVGVIILGTLATSAAGCVVNDLWDRDIDPQVERTRDRPLASRALSVQVGVVVALIAMGCAGILALYLNPFTFWLCVAAVPVIVFYPSQLSGCFLYPSWYFQLLGALVSSSVGVL
jgi:4-hydroxybenzoate polyprenyltransferase